MRRDELVREIEKTVEYQEGLLVGLPKCTSSIFWDNAEDVEIDTDKLTPIFGEKENLSTEELFLLNRYFRISSFIAALASIYKNKENRDKASHSCPTLLSGLGFDPVELFTAHVQLERRWRRVLREHGVKPRSKDSTVLFVIIGIAVFFMVAKTIL